MAEIDGPAVRTTLTEQVISRLRNGISNGTFPAGQLLPSESELSKRYGVSRPVVRNALDVLRNQGMIATVNGIGSYAREHRAPTTLARTRANPWDSLIPSSDPAHRRAYANADEAALYGIPEGEMLFITDRPATREQSGQRVITARVTPVSAFLDATPTPDPFAMTRAALVDFLDQHHGPLTEADGFRAIAADPDQAASLGVPNGAPLTEIIRYTRAADNRLLMTETEISDGPSVQHLITLTPER